MEDRQKDMLDIFAKNWMLEKDANRASDENYLLSGRGGNASGNPSDNDSFIVHAGSKVSLDMTDSFPSNYADLRNSLIVQGIIVDGVFVQNYKFTSSSAAACVVLGRSANGRKEWTLLDGRTLANRGV